MNINGARLVCNQLGLGAEQFYEAIQSFKGAAKRLELVKKNDVTAMYKDFAHSPSKLKATTHAVKKQFPNRKLIACMELHTFSSLTEEFLLLSLISPWYQILLIALLLNSHNLFDENSEHVKSLQ